MSVHEKHWNASLNECSEISNHSNTNKKCVLPEDALFFFFHIQGIKSRKIFNPFIRKIKPSNTDFAPLMQYH